MSNQERAAERRKHWGELIARQQQSGKTVKAFCEENGVGGPSFYAWRKRLKGKIQPVGFALVESAFRSARGHNDGHSDRTGFLNQRGPWEWAKIVQVRHFEQNTNTPTGCSERHPQQPAIDVFCGDMFCRAVPTTVP
jgi:hypothetical protein